MLVKAVVSFSGKVSMTAGEVREIKDQFILNDLMRAGYIEPDAREAEIVEKPVERTEATSEKPVEKSTKKASRKKRK